MAKLTGKGLPTRKTVGALGDIYTDTNTGNKYKCTFAYRPDNRDDFDCEWKLIKKGSIDKRSIQTKEIKDVIPEQKNEETIPEEPSVEQPKRKDYTSYGKMNR